MLGLSKELAAELDKSDTMTEESIKIGLRKVMEDRLKKALYMLRPFSNLLEKEGFQGLAKRLDERKTRWVTDYYEGDPYKFRSEYVWGVTLALRDGCTISEKVGGRPRINSKGKGDGRHH